MGDHLVTRGRASGFIALGRGRRKKKCFSYLLLNHPPPLELIWHSSKMEARTAKPTTSTMLRKNKGLWTAYTMSIYVSFFFPAGQLLLLTMDFVGQQIQKPSNLTLVDSNGEDLETFNITQGQGFYKDTYFVTFVPSVENFRLKVTGIDKNGARFQRIKPTLYSLGDVKLSQKVNN